jgi:hypothetical protein
MNFTNEQIEQMRYELEHPEEMQKRIEEDKQREEFIETTKRMFKEQGRNFDKEYQDWLKQQDNK